MAKETEDTPKVQKPFAPRSGKLPEPLAGCEWDSTEIGPFQFAIQVANSLTGIQSLARTEPKAVGLFNRAWRILVPAQVGARETEKAKMDAEWARKVQADILAFDPAVVKTRAPRTPPSVSIPAGKSQFSLAEVQAMLAGKVQIVVQ